MKKNVLMRAASGLLVATMLTTCAISGTFAKYVTTDDAKDVARVAKWGIVVNAAGDLYGEKYADTTNVVTTETTDEAVSVWGKQAAISTNNVVAPGTKNDGNGLALGLNGTPEVDANLTATIVSQNIYLKNNVYAVMVKLPAKTVTGDNFAAVQAQSENGKLYTVSGGVYTEIATYDADVTDYYSVEDYLDSSEWSVKAADGTTNVAYYPVVYKLTNNNTADTDALTYTGDVNVDTMAEVSKTIANKLAGGTATTAVDGENITTYTVAGTHIEQNTDLVDLFGLSSQQISWEWKFEGTQNTTTGLAEYDEEDTILGNLMAERIDTEKKTSDFKGDVVKLDGANWVQPVEYTDYCLDTKFDITITVVQED